MLRPVTLATLALTGISTAQADGLNPANTSAQGQCYESGTSGSLVPCVLQGQTWTRLLRPTDDASSLRASTGLLGAISRTLAARAADRRNVADFGASLDGSTSDQAAFDAARAATPAGGTIEVPPGGVMLSSDPTGGPAGPVLWRLTGNTYGTSNTPITTMGSDWVENFLGNSGGHYIGRKNSSADGPPVQRIEQTIGYTGGTSGYVVPALQTTTYIPDNGGNLTNYIWNSLSRIYSYANGSSEHTASYMQTNRMAGNTNLWGATIEYRDHTGLDSSRTGIAVGLEIDQFGNGVDDANRRVGIDVVVGPHDPTGPAMEAAYGVRVTGVNGDVTNSSFKTGVSVVSKISNAAFDASQAVMGPNAVAFRVGDSRKLDFSNDGSRYINASAGLLSYFVSGNATPRFQVADDGTFSTFGALQALGGLKFPNFTGSGNRFLCVNESNVTYASSTACN